MNNVRDHVTSEHNILDRDYLLQKQYVAKNTYVEQREGESILEKLQMTDPKNNKSFLLQIEKKEAEPSEEELRSPKMGGSLSKDLMEATKTLILEVKELKKQNKEQLEKNEKDKKDYMQYVTELKL